MNTQQTLLDCHLVAIQSYQEALPQELFTRILSKYKIVSIRQVTDGIIKPLLKDLKEAKAQFVRTKTQNVATNTKFVRTKEQVVRTKEQVVRTNVDDNNSTTTNIVRTNDSTTKSVYTKRFELRLTDEEDDKLVQLSKELNLTKSQVIRELILRQEKN